MIILSLEELCFIWAVVVSVRSTVIVTLRLVSDAIVSNGGTIEKVLLH